MLEGKQQLVLVLAAVALVSLISFNGNGFIALIGKDWSDIAINSNSNGTTQSKDTIASIKDNDSSSSSSSSSSAAAAAAAEMIIDVLSVGSHSRPIYLEAQQRTFGSHVSVRHFYAATEDDDWDQLCPTNLTFEEDVKPIVQKCKRQKYRDNQHLRHHLRGSFATIRWLSHKANPVGWLCAQHRPFAAFYRYMKRLQKDEGDDGLPDYLVVVDDDSYFEMEGVTKYLQQYDPDVPRAIAGCRVRSPHYVVNYTIPYGGFGLIQSRGTLQQYLRPIHCQKNTTDTDDDDADGFSQGACRRLNHSEFDENLVFQEGMSVLDMIVAYNTFQPYSLYKSWHRGFCVHSDWIWGYFLNFYNLSSHVEDLTYANVAESRLEAFNDSEIHAWQKTQPNFRVCGHDKPENCHKDSVICHYQTPDSMMRITDQVRSLHPGRFRNHHNSTATRRRRRLTLEH